MTDIDQLVYQEGIKVYFYAEITDKTALLFMQCLEKAVKEALFRQKEYDIPPKVELYIHSPGGGVEAAFAMIDAITRAKVPVHTIIEGWACSAALLLALAGEKRYMTVHSVCHMHELSGWAWGKLTELKDDVYRGKLLDKLIRQWLRERTQLTKKEVKRRLKRDWWMTAEQALEDGLIDRILE